MMARSAREVAAVVKCKPDLLLRTAWGFLIAALLISALESFVSMPGSDSSVFMYVAKGILEGDVPYLDRWDHKGPLIYLLNAIGMSLFDVWGVWLLEGIFLVGTAWIAYVTMREHFDLASSLFAVALFLGYFGTFVESGNFTEQYALLFQFLSLWLFTRIQKNSMDSRCTLYMIAIGALAAAAFLLRPNLIGLWLAIGIYWIIYRDDWLISILWSTLGAASGPSAVHWNDRRCWRAVCILGCCLPLQFRVLRRPFQTSARRRMAYADLVASFHPCADYR